MSAEDIHKLLLEVFGSDKCRAAMVLLMSGIEELEQRREEWAL